MIATVNLTLYQGEPFNVEMRFSDKNGTPYDLTGYAARMEARVHVADDETKFSWSSATGELILEEDKLTFDVPQDAVNALSTDNLLHIWVYDLFLDDPFGQSRKACKGTITVDPRVTR